VVRKGLGLGDTMLLGHGERFGTTCGDQLRDEYTMLLSPAVITASRGAFASAPSASSAACVPRRLISREGRAGTRMIKMSAAWHGSANSAPRLHRDGRTACTQCHRLVT
jgi:hypothetical protein